ncbi:MAG: hypothetical protein C5S47_06995 [Candidatus Methanogasteraceae archaeon]|nr:MAG: hypothetical protein C5S47_06995 [ANME-2 cluster archaeon]
MSISAVSDGSAAAQALSEGNEQKNHQCGYTLKSVWISAYKTTRLTQKSCGNQWDLVVPTVSTISY